MGGTVDVVIVSYNSAGQLRGAVAPLAANDSLTVTIVDNASRDDSLASVAGLPVERIQLQENGGFAHGCNIGWRRGNAPYVLFLNPDARIEPGAIERLVDVLEQPGNGVVAPRIVDENGTLQYSLRRYPRLRSTFAQAFFLHRLVPQAAWADEIIRDPTVYELPGSVEWASGACLLIRRELLESIGGWDERFFLYCEDIDLCRRAHEHGYDVRYEPAASIVHIGGCSAPRAATLPLLTASRLRYATMTRGAAGAVWERAGIALEAATRFVVGRGGTGGRSGYLRSLGLALGIGRVRPRAAGNEHVDVLLVCSAGGHLLQLLALREAWEPFSRQWATSDRSDSRSLLVGEPVIYTHFPTSRNLKNFVRNSLLAFRVVRRIRPRVVLTTGAATAVPFAWIGRLFGARVVYVESVTRIDSPSLSCRLISPVASRLYVQWPELVARVKGARFAGTVLGQ